MFHSSFDFFSFLFVPFRFVLFRFVPFRSVSFRFVSLFLFRFVSSFSFRFVSFRFPFFATFRWGITPRIVGQRYTVPYQNALYAGEGGIYRVSAPRNCHSPRSRWLSDPCEAAPRRTQSDGRHLRAAETRSAPAETRRAQSSRLA